MKNKFTLFFLIIISLYSCEDDFVSTADWVEQYATYCTLNIKDTAQYARVNRIFLTSGDPYSSVIVADSVNADTSAIQVLLQMWKGGEQVDSIILRPSTDFQKEDGFFSSSGYYTYKTTKIIDPGFDYKLLIRNRETGYEMITKKQVQVLGNRNLKYAFTESKYFNAAQYQNYAEQLPEYSGSLLPNQFEKRITRLLYYEYTDTDTLMKVLDWRPYYDSIGKGGKENQLPPEFYMYMGENIPVDPNIKRRAVAVDKMLVINDEELEIYIQISNSANSSHHNPTYSSYDKGAGIFACRYYYTFFGMKLKDVTLHEISWGQYTTNLRFADENGEWH